MLNNKSFARGAALGALVTTILGIIGVLGTQGEAIATRDFILRQHLAEYASDRDRMQSRLERLEAIAEGMDNMVRGLDGMRESDVADIRALIRNQQVSGSNPLAGSRLSPLFSVIYGRTPSATVAAPTRVGCV